MINVHVIRDVSLDDATLGSLIVGDLWLRTLELPWKDNLPNISCIPAGEYRCDYLEKSASGKYKRCWHVREVPGRTGCLFHSGNIPSHTRGCLLLGVRRGWLKGRPAVFNSRSAMAALLNHIGPVGFRLVIDEAL